MFELLTNFAGGAGAPACTVAVSSDGVPQDIRAGKLAAMATIQQLLGNVSLWLPQQISRADQIAGDRPVHVSG